MSVIKSIVIAFSMFSIMPMPRVEWDKQNMKFALAFMPLVGAVIGAVLYGWLLINKLLGFGSILFAAGITAIPIAISGAIHMDGFCDTIDALSSHADTEKKRAILKDPHTGAFAVIGACVYFLLYFTLATELPMTFETVYTLGIIHVISRALAGLVCAIMTPKERQGLGSTFHDAASGASKLILWFIIGIAAAAIVLLGGRTGAFVLISAAIAVTYTVHIARKEFGGISGDLAGFLIQLLEIAAVTIICITWKVRAIWF